MADQVSPRTPISAYTRKSSEASSLWPGRSWVPAEQHYPGEKDSQRTTKGISASASAGSVEDVVIYDCATKEFDVRPLDTMNTQRAIFCRLPSRRAQPLYVCVERFTPEDAVNAPRYRVTDHQITPGDMVVRHVVELGRLGLGTKMRILAGRIKWIFVLNVSAEINSSAVGSPV